jgi:hypothetical protein
VRPLLGLCLDDAFYFVTRERTRKGMNLAGTPAVVSLPGIAGSEEGGDRRLSPNAEGSGPQATGIDYRLPGWYVRIATPVGDVFESTSVSRLSGFPSRKRRLPPPTTIGWIINRYSSTRS